MGWMIASAVSDVHQCLGILAGYAQREETTESRTGRHEQHSGRTSLAESTGSEGGKLHRWLPTPRTEALSPAMFRVEARSAGAVETNIQPRVNPDDKTQVLAREWLQQQKRHAASQPAAPGPQADSATLEELRQQPGLRHRWAPTPQQLAAKKQQIQAQQQAAEQLRRRQNERQVTGAPGWGQRPFRGRSQTAQV